MARTKLAKIGERALKEPDFFEALVVDPEGTLRQYGMSPTKPDLNLLKRGLKSPAGVKLREFIRLVHAGNHGELFMSWGGVSWMGAWIPIRPPRTLTPPLAQRAATRGRKTRGRTKR